MFKSIDGPWAGRDRACCLGVQLHLLENSCGHHKVVVLLSSCSEDTMSYTSIREKDGVTIVDLSGPITLGEASQKLRDTVRESLSKG